jgi:hypothetical protein
MPFLQSLLNTINYNSSQSMSASDLLHSLLDYDCSSTVTDLVLIYKWLMDHEGRMTTEEWMCPYLHGWFYSLAGTMENVCCWSVDTETHFIPSRSPGIHISIGTCVNFTVTMWFSNVYNFQFSYQWKSLSNTQWQFVQELYLRGNVFANSFPRNAYMSYHIFTRFTIL